MNGQSFTAFGILVLVLAFMTFAAGKYSKMIVTLLSVVLLSMVLINWNQIRPLILKEA